MCISYTSTLLPYNNFISKKNLGYVFHDLPFGPPAGVCDVDAVALLEVLFPDWAVTETEDRNTVWRTTEI